MQALGPLLVRGPSASERRLLGDDEGCFAAALWAVRTFGGVLEHPEASHAWRWFGLRPPLRSGTWMPAEDGRGYTCCVEQGHYGHRARKATWLYVVGLGVLPRLVWGPSEAGLRRDEGYHSAEERRRAVRTGTCQRLSKSECAATPEPFRDLLLEIARSCRV